MYLNHYFCLVLLLLLQQLPVACAVCCGIARAGHYKPLSAELPPGQQVLSNGFKGTCLQHAQSDRCWSGRASE